MISRRIFLKAGAVLGAGLFFPWRISLPGFLKALLPSKSTSTAEQDLIRRLLAGDSEAFAEFYAAYSPAVYRYIRFRVNSDTDAEDLTAEVFIKAWRSLPVYEWRAQSSHPHMQVPPLESWLFRIAHNLIIDKKRKRRAFQLSDFAGSKAFDALSHEDQVILYLSEHAGYSNQKIARVLGKSENAVGVARFRAIKRLEKNQRWYLN